MCELLLLTSLIQVSVLLGCFFLEIFLDIGDLIDCLSLETRHQLLDLLKVGFGIDFVGHRLEVLELGLLLYRQNQLVLNLLDCINDLTSLVIHPSFKYCKLLISLISGLLHDAE
jgi:hypothetical protein